MSPEPTTTSPQASPALNDVRSMLLGMGLGMIVLCVAFGAFVIRQNLLVSQTTKFRLQQAEQVKGGLQKQEALKQWELALNELAQYSKGNSELVAIFTKYRVDISNAGATTPPAPEPKQ